jgi:hypothetical protein
MGRTLEVLGLAVKRSTLLLTLYQALSSPAGLVGHIDVDICTCNLLFLSCVSDELAGLFLYFRAWLSVAPLLAFYSPEHWACLSPQIRLP